MSKIDSKNRREKKQFIDKTRRDSEAGSTTNKKKNIHTSKIHIHAHPSVRLCVRNKWLTPAIHSLRQSRSAISTRSHTTATGEKSPSSMVVAFLLWERAILLARGADDL